MKNKQILGTVLLMTTAVIWGTAFVAQRVGMDSIQPYSFTAARMALAALAVGLVAVLLRRPCRREAGAPREDRAACRKNTILGGVCCGVFLTVASLFQQFGIVTTTAGKAGFITAMYILLVPVMDRLIFGKKHSLRVWAAVLIGVAGMYLLCVGDGMRITKGDALVCGCAIVFSCHILCVDSFVRRGDAIWMAVIQFACSAVLSGIGAWLFEKPSWDQFAAAAIPILYCGLLSGGVGYTLQIVAQRFTDPTVASLLMSLESVFAVLAGALLLHERMSAREALGCVVLFAAIALVQLPGRTRAKDASKEGGA